MNPDEALSLLVKIAAGLVVAILVGGIVWGILT